MTHVQPGKHRHNIKTKRQLDSTLNIEFNSASQIANHIYVHPHHTSFVLTPRSPKPTFSSLGASILLSTISIPLKLGNRLLKSAMTSSLSLDVISGLATSFSLFGGEPEAGPGPVLMLFKCIGFGGAFGLALPVLEAVAGSGIGRGIEFDDEGG